MFRTYRGRRFSDFYSPWEKYFNRFFSDEGVDVNLWTKWTIEGTPQITNRSLVYTTELKNDNEGPYVITVEVPGVPKEDIKVEHEHGALTITAGKKGSLILTLPNYVLDRGNFQAEAKIENGLLTITAVVHTAGVQYILTKQVIKIM